MGDNCEAGRLKEKRRKNQAEKEKERRRLREEGGKMNVVRPP
jgi:hypothetical protein